MSTSLRIAGALLAMTVFAPAGAADRYLNVSGLWLDAERAAQGLMIEQIDPPGFSPDGEGTRVIVSWFTWAPAGDAAPGARWLYGIGRRTDARIVVDPVLIAREGEFPSKPSSPPAGLDVWGRLEIEVESDGRLVPTGAILRYEGPAAWGEGERRLAQITASGYGISYGLILDPPLPNVAAASGNYSSPAHPGQGWVLNQYVREDRDTQGRPRNRVEALLIWYTYDAQGQPAWLFGIAQDMEATPLFSMQRAREGGTFDGGDPELESWGDVRLFGAGPPAGFQVSCSVRRLDWQSSWPDFGAGSLQPRQLTSAYRSNMTLPFCFSTGGGD